MALPAHIGLEHPNLLWFVVVGLIAFGAGLVVNLYRSKPDATLTDDTPVSEE